MISDFGFRISDLSIAHPEECEHRAGERKSEIRNPKSEMDGWSGAW